MKITKLEQSGFIFETDNGYRLAIDIGAYTPLDKLKGLSVDALIASHLHGDHFSVEHIEKLSPKKLYLNRECIELLTGKSLVSKIIEVKVGDSVNIDGIKVTFFNVDHGPNTKVKPKENFGFMIEVDGQKVYFAGDMFYPSGVDVSTLEADYALVPVGSFYTFGPNEAFDFTKQFKKISKIIPMHFESNPEKEGEFARLVADEQRKNIAYIDGQNFHMGTTKREIGPWKVDLARFRVYLEHKYNVGKAYYFLGFVQEENQDIYEEIQSAGFVLMFREHNSAMIGKKKGNVDSDIIFNIMKKLYKKEEFGKVVLVSGDGDYKLLVDFLIEEGRFEKILFPDRKRASSLYKKIGARFFDALDTIDIRDKIEKKKKAP